MDLISHKLLSEGGKEVMEELKHYYLSGETHGIYPKDIPEHLDSKDSSEEDFDFEDELDDLESMDLEDQLEYLLNDDVSEIGFDPYLGCYTDDC